MDKNGFRVYLQERNLSNEEIDASIQLAERFIEFTQDTDIPGSDDLLNFSAELIETGDNTVANYYALARYAYFTDNHEVYIAAVDLLDGAEVMDNLYQRAEAVLGTQRRDVIFDGVDLPQLGLPNEEKVRVTQVVMSRLVDSVAPQECEQILANSLRDLDEAWYRDEVSLYQECTSLDDFLDKNAQNFIALLEMLRDEGKPFFTQFIDDQVVEYLHSLPMMREHNGLTLVHANPRDPESWNYIFTLWDAEMNFPHFEGAFCFIGHSHQPVAVEMDCDGTVNVIPGETFSVEEG